MTEHAEDEHEVQRRKRLRHLCKGTSATGKSQLGESSRKMIGRPGAWAYAPLRVRRPCARGDMLLTQGKHSAHAMLRYSLAGGLHLESSGTWVAPTGPLWVAGAPQTNS